MRFAYAVLYSHFVCPDSLFRRAEDAGAARVLLKSNF